MSMIKRIAEFLESLWINPKFYPLYLYILQETHTFPYKIQQNESLEGRKYLSISFKKGHASYWCFTDPNEKWVIQHCDLNSIVNKKEFYKRQNFVEKNLNFPKNATFKDAIHYCASAILMIKTKKYESEHSNSKHYCIHF